MMKNEKLQFWALVAEIVGGVALVFSLVFVGLEIRQSSDQAALNTRAMEVSAYQDLIAQILSLNNMFIDDPELSELWASVQDCEPVESRAQREQLTRYAINVIRHGDMAYHQYEQGLISKERLDNALGILVGQIRTAYPVRARWESGSRYGPFKEHVDRLLMSREREDYLCPHLMTDR